jgi:hypothetical protein
MTPADRIRSALHDLGIYAYDLRWAVSPRGKPHSFRLSFRDVTIQASSPRTVLRAIRRRFPQKIAA